MAMNKDEFVALVKNNQKLIFKVCTSYCSNPENRKDLQQEILIQLWNAFPKYNGSVKLSTWMYRIALNTAISFFRKDCKHAKRRSDVDASVISLPETDDGAQNERIKSLYQCIEQLKPADKALMLLYLDDVKQAEIADILGISQTNVSTKIGRIKKELGKRMGRE